MNIVVILLLFIVIYKAEFVRNGINEEYLSINTSKKINGIFVIFVFLSHSLSYVNYSSLWIDKYGESIIIKLGQFMVTTFLFFSGYGVYESIKTKNNYINKMPKKRILDTLIKFDIAVFIYLAISYILNINYSLKTILLSFIGWKSIGNSNWYIFTILILYTITYIVFKLFKSEDKIKILLITFLTVVYMILISKFKQDYWYNTALCYPFGMWISMYKTQIENIIKKYPKSYYLALIITIIAFYIAFIFKDNVYVYSIYAMLFVFIIVLLSMKVKLNSKFLTFMGSNVFYIYIYQRIPMIILNKCDIYFGNRYLFFIISFITIIEISLAINVKNIKRKEKSK